MTLQELVQALAGFRQVLVTGPQRSGTTIAAEILAGELGYACLREEAIDTDRLERLFLVYSSVDGFVLQAPGVCAYCHQVPGAVVLMRRDVGNIVRSQSRVGWGRFAVGEAAKYFRDSVSDKKVAALKYDVWDRFQKRALGDRAFELKYSSLRGHRLWVPRERRVSFGMRQTR